MRHFLFLWLALSIPISVFSQDNFNKWSIEASVGPNKSMGPLTPGYLSPTLNLGHADLGLRYMFNEYFGIKGDLGFGSFSEAKGVSPKFKTNYARMNIQGVGNIGKMLDLPSLSRKIGLLAHFGSGIGLLDFQNSRLASKAEYNYNFIGGMTAQIKLSEKLALTGDISAIYNGRQTYTFDGNNYNVSVQPKGPNNPPFVHAPGTWWTGTLGLTYYLGKDENHADWFIEADKYATKEEINSQINGIKDMLKDSDSDGIPDYLDSEPNTPAGARVDSKGKTIDSDGDGLPDHIDKCPFLPGPSSTNGCPVEQIKEELDYFKKAITEGYVNVYYAFDSAKPLDYSSSSAGYVANFMKRNPGVNVEIKGYADELGPEDYNMKLSEKRAKAVYDLLVSSGVDASRLSYKGYGEDTSVDKASADARQMARRASFEIK
jgi:OOP family OmpA-OmpF porin